MRLDMSLVKPAEIQIVPICPEQLAGLPTPRDPVEIQGGDGFDVLKGRAVVRTEAGEDLSEAFRHGARVTAQITELVGATLMVTQLRSPSCSCDTIYDGSFGHRLRPGVGVTAACLKVNTDVELIRLDDFESRIRNGKYCRAGCR